MIKGFLQKRYSNKSFSAVVEEFFEAAVFGFGFLLLYSIYRASRGYALDHLSSAISAGYLKFLFIFLLFTSAAYLVFFVLLDKRIWLDALLGLTWASALIGFIVFSVGTGYAAEARIVAIIISAYLCHYLFNVRELGLDFKLGNRAAGIFLLTAVGAIFGLTFILGVARHRIFLTSDFDLGIFDQMFYMMAHGKAPITTSVGYAINHMIEIHFSPIFYLFVPIYKLFPSPETLLFLQSLFACLAAIPLYRIAHAHGLDQKISLLLAIAFLLQPGYFGGQLKDFHEIKLFPFFFLNFVYFFERNEDSEKRFNALTLLFLVLSLSVKEDSAIYLIAYAAPALFRSSTARKKALIVILVSLLTFAIVTGFVLGDESDFTYRYRSLLPNWAASSLSGLGKVFLTSPFAIITRVFTAPKLELYSLLLLPLALIPLFGARRLKNLSLLIPFAALNVLQDLEWQSMDNQYFMGTVSCFLLIVISELQAMKKESNRTFFVRLILLSTILLTLSAHLQKMDYLKKYKADRLIYAELETELSEIPSDLSASGSSHIYPHLSKRAEIYPTAFGYQTDIIAIDLRSAKDSELFQEIIDLIEGDSHYGVRSYRREYWVILEKSIETDETNVVLDEMRYLIQQNTSR